MLFFIVGLVGFAADASSYFIIRNLLNEHISRLFAFSIAVNITYYFNKRYTFPGKSKRYILYILGQVKGLMINFLVFEMFLYYLALLEWGVQIAFVAGSVAALCFNYLYAKHLVFGTK